MSQMLNKMYIIIHSRDDLQYLLSVIYIMMCTGFVSAWRLSTEHVVAQPLHLYLFPPGVKVWATIGWLPPYTLSCDYLKFYVTV